MAYPDDDAASSDDLTLVRSARAGDRLAFGLLYLRHHAAAWRVACVASRFSPDAELAVIEGFTRVFSALPEEAEEFASGDVTFRPYVLASVRQAALDRARSAGRSDAGNGPGGPPASSLAGLGSDGEVVLSTLEHHMTRGALAALPERPRTALWLSDVEAMTPGEVASILGGTPQEMAAAAADARTTIHAIQHAALGREEVRAGCRFTVDQLDAYLTGSLDPAEGLIVRSHLDGCPPCRMRQAELANAPAALAAAVPDPPLLGGEAQHHWLDSVPHLRPAERLLPPGLAAGGVARRGRHTLTRFGTVAGAAAAPARRLPDVLRRAGRAAAGSWLPQSDSVDLTGPGPADAPGQTPSPDQAGSPGWSGTPGWSGLPTPAVPPEWTIPPGRVTTPDRKARRAGLLPVAAGRLPVLVRRAGRAVAPLPSLSFFIVCMVLTLAVPHLMTPDTAPGPGSLASPAVQAYVPGAGLAGRGSARGSGPAVAPRTTEVAAALPGGTATAATAGPGTAPGPVVQLIATATRPRPVRPAPAPVTPAAAAVTAAATTTPVPTVTPSPVVSPAASPPGTTSPAGPAAKTNSGAKAVKPSKADRIGPSLKGHKRVDAGAKSTAAKEKKTARPARKAVSPRRIDGA